MRHWADLFEANDSATKLAFLRAGALKERSDSPLNFETKNKEVDFIRA